MSRGKKSKLHNCEKRCQAQGEEQGLGDAQGSAAGEEESQPHPLPLSGSFPTASMTSDHTALSSGLGQHLLSVGVSCRAS